MPLLADSRAAEDENDGYGSDVAVNGLDRATGECFGS